MHQPIPQLPDVFFMVDSAWLKYQGAKRPSRITRETLAQAIAVNEIILQGYREALAQLDAHNDEWQEGVLANLEELAEEVKRALGGPE